ncbi:MAG: cation-translocating P-type ATPase [Paludibacteraceae bacterium]
MKQNHHYLGLNDAQVIESRQKNGVNILTPPEKEPLWKQFIEKFEDPLIRILMVAGLLSIGISCYEYWHLNEGPAVFFEPIGIFIAILLATGLAFYFELKANKAFSILNQVNDDEAVKVIRNSNVVEIPKKDVVVGDVVILNTGDEVPADGELLESVTLQMDESSLTGEPVCSKTTNAEEFDKEATFSSNCVLRGTKVMEGHGVFEVKAVGDKTENGKVFEEAQIDDSVKTPLNEQLDGLSDLITNLSYAFAAAIIVGRLCHFFSWNALSFTLLIPTVIFFYLVIKKFEDWSSLKCITSLIVFFSLFVAMVVGLHNVIMPGEELSGLLAFTMSTLMIAVTLIVVAVPEGLPMAVTLSLAYSMRSMLKTNNLVRKMHACETMGATTVICTDKTGTLTQNKMQVDETQFYDLKGQMISKEDNISNLIVEGISVNSTASLDLSEKTPKIIGNPTEGALLLWLYNQGVDYRAIKENSERVAEIPFSTERKYMATIVKSVFSDRKIIFVKGAPEIVFGMCANSCGNISKTDVDKQLLTYQRRAMRTLGFAYQILDDEKQAVSDGDLVAKDLIFLGIVAISDPVRLDVPPAVKECMDAGISVKIVTGDTPGTAKEIGRQIGLWKESDTERNIITGPEFAALSDKQLQDRVVDLKIIARARPMDKKRLVEALQAKNQVVAVTGDGTNDAPALNAAHVGLSMGDGTSVAKEASDITIIDNSFSSIGRAVMWGRSLFQNIQRFLLFQLTVNVSACFIVLVGAFIGTESPLTVTQMLWVNLIMDTFGAMALASLPPSENVMRDKPRDRNAFILNTPMYRNVLGVGFAFFLMLLGLVLYFGHADITSMRDFLSISFGETNSISPYEQTLLFSIFVWTHFWYMFNARSFETGKSIFNTKLSKGFMTIIGVIAIGQILIVEVLYSFFNVVPMKLEDWIIIVVGSSVVLWIRELWHLLLKSK